MHFIDFELPKELIATHPTPKRDGCKLLVLDRKTKKIEHRVFADAIDYLNPTDHLVINDAKVSPKRVYWTDPKGERQELVLLNVIASTSDQSEWEAIVSGKGLPLATPFDLTPTVSFQIESRKSKVAHIRIFANAETVDGLLWDQGELPIPPYIRKKRLEQNESAYQETDNQDYQTVFAKTPGASAAPTAGLHLTKSLLGDIQQKGLDVHSLFLEVGWGTFSPLEEKHFTEKKLHEENVVIPEHVTAAIHTAHERQERVIAVGTTVVRSLESWAQKGKKPGMFRDATDLFIYPPFDFACVGGLITNFHLPKSSLLMLVAAFIGEDGEQTLLNAYHEAIEKKYRFFSYGDAMLIL